MRRATRRGKPIHCGCAGLLLAGLVVGCSAPTAEENYAPSGQQNQARDYRAEVADLARAYGIEELPEVEVVRTTTPFDLGTTQAQCMTDEGFPSQADERGVVTAELLDEQEQEHKLATIVCLLRYPLGSIYLEPPTRGQLEAKYAWTRDVLVPCIRDVGYEPQELPSLELFVAQEQGAQGGWFPFTEDHSQEVRTEIVRSCDLNVPPEVLWERP